ncbi:hypothetical protein C0991_012322 [Blastosporella zonata]|nr:hypothetical protein C0991_012322 [Blastosporella zonata]
MSKYSSFAVVGAGYVGLHVIKAFVEQNASVLVLTSSSSKHIPNGVKTVHVKYADIATVTRALQDSRVEVVISTLSTDGLSSQNNVAEASKGASVKLFLPSEFGIPTEGSKSGVFAAKDKSAKMIPDLVGLRSNGKVNILSKLEGKAPVSFTSIDDTSASLVEVASILETSVEQVSEIPSPDFSLAGPFQEHFETGAGSTGWDAEEEREGTEKAGCSNSLWEGHHWKSISEVLPQK